MGVHALSDGRATAPLPPIQNFVEDFPVWTAVLQPKVPANGV